MPAETLHLALLHLAPHHGQPDLNRWELLAAVEAAAAHGAQLILAPELAISGYSFENRHQADALAETEAGPTITALAASCRRLGVYCAIGLLERNACTGVLHNTAFALGPQGCVIARHRKQVSERRWATPGNPSPDSLFETPWGRMGLLVCADSYFGLPARTLALQGADMLLVLANWPPGGVDPRTIWRARALENGVGLVACNRTGLDREMDCREAHSFAVTPQGLVLLEEASAISATFLVDWPLTDGRLTHLREGALSGRRPGAWRSLGLDGNILQDSSYLWGSLPEAPVNLGIAVQGQWTPDQLPVTGPSFFLLPVGSASDHALTYLQNRDWPQGLVLAGSGSQGPFLATGNGLEFLGERSCLLRAVGGFRVALTRPEHLRHPEAAVALAKEGCDLVGVPCEVLEADTRSILATRCLERLPVALATPEEAVLFLPPEGHGPWGEIARLGPGLLQVRLDVGAYRKRHIFDRLDLDTLLCPSAT